MKNDYIIRQFCSQDKLRPFLHNPLFCDGYVYATETHTLIRTRPENLSLQYKNTDEIGGPIFSKVWGETPAPMAQLTLEQVLPVLEHIRVYIRHDKTTCPKCKGAGELYCDHCEQTNECKKCEGTGTLPISAKMLARYVSFERDGNTIHYIKIGNNNYNPVYIELVFFAMLAAGASEATYAENDNTRGYFSFGVFEVIVTCMLVDGE